MSPESTGHAGNGNGKQKVFVPRDALMSRANSLKKALKQIIEHAEQGTCMVKGNLVPRVSLLPAKFGGKKRDPGNEVGSRVANFEFLWWFESLKTYSEVSTLPLPLDKVFDLFFDNFLMAFISTGQSKCKNYERRSCQAPRSRSDN